MSEHHFRFGRFHLRRSSMTPGLSKRVLDLIGAALIIVFFAPLMLCIAIAIKISSRGPVLAAQTRYGRGSILFRMWSFRTSYGVGADAERTDGRQENRRPTPVGRVLRHSGLADFPRFFNVIVGQMSLVGPEPHGPDMKIAGMAFHDLAPDYFDRHAVKPGITGLAQVNGLRGRVLGVEQLAAILDYDHAYARAHSTVLDLKILGRALLQEFILGTND